MLRSIRHLLLFGPLLLCAGWFFDASPKGGALFTEQSAESALRKTKAFVQAVTPRDSGTPKAKEAAEWIHQELAGVPGLSLRTIVFNRSTPKGPQVFRNVLASLPGKENRWVLLLTHYDTKPGVSSSFQGANDGGSSTGLMLELARIFAEQKERRLGILIAFLDGEESMVDYTDTDGLHGSKHLAVLMKAEKRNITAVLLADMIGDADFHLGIPENVTPRLRKIAETAAKNRGLEKYIHAYSYRMLDDHQPFLDLGYPAIDFIDFEYGPRNSYWHTPQDTVDKLGPTGYLVTGGVICEMMQLLETP